jgi:hypothetical protein
MIATGRVEIIVNFIGKVWSNARIHPEFDQAKTGTKLNKAAILSCGSIAMLEQ